jgi:hypothetical protein
MSWRSCANRSRRVSQEYNFAGVINFAALATLAAVAARANLPG